MAKIKNPVENGVITTKLDEMQDEYESLIWTGTYAEYEEALANGEIKEGTFLSFLCNPGFNLAWVFYVPSQMFIALSMVELNK